MYYNSAYPPQRCEVVKVNGRAGAETFQLAPNSSILLLDTSAPIVWLKTTDGAGYPSLVPYSITPYEEAPPIDLAGLVKRIDELEEKVNAKSNATAVEPAIKPADLSV